MSSLKIVSLNCRGLCAEGRLKTLLGQAARKGVAILMLQETNLQAQHIPRAKATANMLGYEPCIGEADRTGAGAAIFVSRKLTDLPQATLSAHTRVHMRGRLVVVDIPRGSDDPLRVASMYVPAQPTHRRHYVNKLAESNYLEGVHILGTDANCVASVLLDTTASRASDYPNVGGAELERSLAARGLHDLYREIEGNEHKGGFTRVGHNIATRIDRLYVHESIATLWKSVCLDDTYGSRGWMPDHRAVTAIPVAGSPGSRPPRRATIRHEVYAREATIDAIHALAHTVEQAFPQARYGATHPYETMKVTAKALLLDLSKDVTPPVAGPMRLHEIQLQRTADDASPHKPHLRRAREAFKTALHTLQEKRRQVSTYKELARANAQDRSTKEFFSHYRAKRNMEAVPELYPMCGTDRQYPDDDSQLTPPHAVAAKYTEALMQPKPSIEAHILLQKIKNRPAKSKLVKKAGDTITEHEVRKAIRALPRRKAPGPDGIHNEFYIHNENAVAPMLTQALNEIHRHGLLPDSFLQGEITYIYKKKDPHDIRNYRPITLLNTDYKILTRILTKRIEKGMKEFVSAEQNGFVPGRQITDNTWLCKLLQAYLDEKDEPGMFLFLDLEKAFDRVSHQYLLQAVEAAGLPPGYVRWIELLYNRERPPIRRARVNNETSDFFPIQSGTAQGCPLSPVLFLFITEGFTRLVNEDDRIEGIKLQDSTAKISHFADDTILIPRSYEEARIILEESIPVFEKATGMALNASKTEGLLLGRLRRERPPPPPSLSHIKWCADGSSITSLGVPFGYVFDEESFWERKITAATRMAAGWARLRSRSLHGRAMLVNAKILSRFRYWAQTMLIPHNCMKRMCELAHRIVWEHSPQIDSQPTRSARRKLPPHTARRAAQEGGISMLNWTAHTKALTVKPWLQYMDGTRRLWKTVLDEWVRHRHSTGRGAPISTNSPDSILQPLGSQGSHLPPLLLEGLRTLQRLKPTPTTPNHFATAEEAKAEPAFDSLRCKLQSKFEGWWRTSMNHQRMGDFAYYGENGNDSPSLWPSAALTPLLEEAIPPTRAKRPSNEPSSALKALFDYDRLERQLPECLVSRLTDTHTITHDPRYSAKARKIMHNSGWKRLASGSLPPDLDELKPMRGKPGLQTKRNRDDNKPLPYDTIPEFVHPTGQELGERDKDPPTKKLRATQAAEGETRYVYEGYQYGWLGTRDDGESLLHVVELNGDGIPVRAGLSIVCHPDDTCPVARWNRGVLGPAEFVYPHPQRWTLRYSTNATPLTKLRTKTMTEIIATKEDGDGPPNAQAKWEAALDATDIPWHHVWKKVCHPLLTRLDIKNMLTVLHRKIWNPESGRCPNCDVGEDRLSHIIQCPYTEAVFRRLFPHDSHDATFLVLGLRNGKVPLRGLEAMLHTLAWKYIYASIVDGRLHGTPPPRERNTVINVIQLAQRRLRAGAAKLNNEILRRKTRGEEPDPDVYEKHSAKIAPAKYDERHKVLLPNYLMEYLRE